jgi:hypothetical protein
MLSGGDASAADINGPSERGAERPEVDSGTFLINEKEVRK